MLRAWFLFGVVALGCANTAYRCDPTHACNAGSTCTATGYCAEPVAATRCASGLRYSASADAPGTCVPEADAAAPDVVADAPDVVADAPDAPPDLPPPMDAPPDLPPPVDAPPDVGPDARPDVAADVALDARPDAPPDVAHDAARDVAPDIVTAPDAAGACTVRPFAPLAGTRISHNVLTVVLSTTGAVTSGVVEYGPSPTELTRTASLTMRGANSFSATFMAPGRRVFWRPTVRCADGSSSSAPTWWTQHRRTTSTEQGLLGWAPDVNRDGLADLVASATRVSDPPFVRVYLSSGAGAFENIPVPPGDDGFGARVAVVPDMNGDGAAEVAIGSCVREQGASCNRVVNVYTRAGGAWSAYASVAMPDPSTTNPELRRNARFGATLAGLGDLDEDGYGDLLIGAPPNADADAGAVYILYGGPSPTLSVAYSLPALPSARPPRRRFGWSAAGVGDLNLDGHVDFVVTSFERVWVYRGTGARSLPTAEELAFTAGMSTSFGFAAAAAGDVDGDQRADFALGRADETPMGDVTIVRGRSETFTGVGAASPGVHTAAGSGGGFGMTVIGALDYDGDDRDEIVVSAPGTSPAPVFAGWLLGSALLTQAVDAPLGARRFGFALGAPGDHDGDGLDDVAASAIDGTDSAGVVHRLRGSSNPAQAFVPAGSVSAQPHTFGQEIGR